MTRTHQGSDRKEQILNVADRLFQTKGFDSTSIRDILEETQIARGTLYYHFQSKEEIMDALIDRFAKTLLAKARHVAQDKSIPALPRLFLALQSLNMRSDDAAGMLDFMHQPQNALMNEKHNRVLFTEVPPILEEIVRDGIEEGVFQMEYPYEATEMAVVYIGHVFGQEFLRIPEEIQHRKILGFLANLERLFGATPGSFAELAREMMNENDWGMAPTPTPPNPTRNES